MASLEILPMTPDHIDGFHRTLDVIARERRYLAFLEAPPLDSTRAFVLDLIRRGCPQYVAVAEGEVVGWCDLRSSSENRALRKSDVAPRSSSEDTSPEIRRVKLR